MESSVRIVEVLTTFLDITDDGVLTHQTSEVTPPSDLSDDVIHISEISFERTASVKVLEKKSGRRVASELTCRRPARLSEQQLLSIRQTWP